MMVTLNYSFSFFESVVVSRYNSVIRCSKSYANYQAIDKAERSINPVPFSSHLQPLRVGQGCLV